MSINTKANGTTHTLLEKSDIFNMIYPVGSVYFSRSGTYGSGNADFEKMKCPLATYGGTWQLVDFTITNVNNGQYVVDNANGTISNGNNIQLYNSNGGYGQRWRLGLWRYNYVGASQGLYPNSTDSKHGYLLTWVRIA